MTFDTEAKFEQIVIRQLVESGWEPEVIRHPSEEDLITNWAQILFNNNRGKDNLNGCPLTETEMQQILEQIIKLRTPMKLNDFINGKSVSIIRDNPADQAHYGQEVSLKIYDRKEIAAGESRYQIVEQPHFKTAPILNNRRGDLMLLINGMPVIHIELKKSGIPVSNAYHQIEKYAHEGVFTGIFSLIQIFVAMEPEEAVYFANPGPDGEFNPAFYFHWADFDNEPINNWKDVISELLNIPMAHTLVGFYTIPDDKDDTLKVMRSYQYYAATRIADKVTKKDWSDTNLLGGYVWHTTGSGKTLTSFKSAQLIANWQDADKVIFLVDRKSLGRQSFDDYNAFASKNEFVQDTADTQVLVSKLESDDTQDTLIVTSIQKLSKITKDAPEVSAAALEKIVAKRIVIIIDEAHRSTFGDMLTHIKETFVHSLIFGFTGTPIQDVNKKKDNTTNTVFGNELHRYTLADGIRDKNVLGFDPYMVLVYPDNELRKQVALMKAKASKPEDVFGDKKKEKIYYRFMDSSKVKMIGEQRGQKYYKGIEDYVPRSQYETSDYQKTVVQDIVDNWVTLSHNGLFHAIFATSSIPEAVQYYRLFKVMSPHLVVTAVFDPNIDDASGTSLEKEDGINEMLLDYDDRFSKDYNFPSYDQFRDDIQLRLAHKKPYNNIARDQQINLLIVVNQMLTGYDSKWINTLYLDKVLEYENLIQAFSRTNRLYGDEKPFGTIKYYRYPHTMARNIEAAVKAYSGDVPTGLFVDKLPTNLRRMNALYADIEELFKNAGIVNFEKLPEEKAVCGKFAKLFKNFMDRLEAAQIQGFSWSKNNYIEILDDGSENYIQSALDESTYLTLVQRYKELPSGGGGGMGGEPPFDIDTHITQINTDAIDANYMNSRFDKFFRLWKSGNFDQDQFEKTLNELHKSFAMLKQEEQRCADLFLRDVQAGSVQVDPNKTFRDYISDYMQRAEDARISRIVRRLGVYADKLKRLLNLKVTEQNLNDFGRFDELVGTVDTNKAGRFFLAIEGPNYKAFKLRMYVYNYLKDFILSGGKDPYENAEDSRTGRGEQADMAAEGLGSYHVNRQDGTTGQSVTNNGDEPYEHITITVKSRTLSKWASSSNAVASLMKTGGFAYVEEKVCLDKSEYVKREQNGKIRLTEYAKQHEEECFLQFVTDENGRLHYVKLPSSVADKEYRYSDYVSDDILRQIGLVSEISKRMLEAIDKMEFGPALKELMSKRICNYSIALLQSTTGLDNKTINRMRDGDSLTQLNVVSACLGIHIPFPVSNAMLELANIVFRADRPPESNAQYINLLTTRWASDYSDVYDDLKAEGLESLIKKPPM